MQGTTKVHPLISRLTLLDDSLLQFCYSFFLTLNDGDLLMSDVYILLHALDSASVSVLSLLQDGFTKRRLEPCFLDWAAR